MEGIGQGMTAGAAPASASGPSAPGVSTGVSPAPSRAPVTPITWAPVAPEHHGADAWDLPKSGELPRLDGAPAFEPPVSRQPLDVTLRGALGREPSHEERAQYGALRTAMQAAGKTDAQFTALVQGASEKTRDLVDEVVRQELGLQPDFFRLPKGGQFHAAAVALLHEQPGRSMESLEQAVRAQVQDAPEWKLKRPDEWARRVAQRVSGDAGAADRARLGAFVASRAKELLADRSASKRDVASQIEAELEDRLTPLARAA